MAEVNLSNKILLSIVIPHYNSPKSLSELLTSICQHDAVEVIVVDDKSTVEWQYVAEEYPYVHFIENQRTGKGPGTARNIGLDHASGKWLLFADADDILLEGWYELVSKRFESKQDIIFFPPDSLDIRTGEKNTPRAKWFVSLCRDYWKTHSDKKIRSCFSPPWSKLIRRSLIEDNQLRFDEIMQAEDCMFSAKLGFYAAGVSVVPKPFYRLMDHDGSMTTDESKEALLLRLQVLCERYNFWKGKKGYEGTLRLLRNDGLNLLLRVRRYGWKTAINCAIYMLKAGVRIPVIRVVRLVLFSVKRRILALVGKMSSWKRKKY